MFRTIPRIRKNNRHRQKSKPSLEQLEARLAFSVDVPLVDLTEGTQANWSTFASDNAATSVAADTSLVRDGSRSLRFRTESGFDTGVRISPSGQNWNVSGVNLFEFWAHAQNSNAAGFQGGQPVIRLNSPNGSVTLTPSQQLIQNNAWTKIHVPLAGDSRWQRSESGSFDSTEVTGVEIHHDTWDYGFTIFYDGVRFAQRDANSRPPAGPTPPPAVNPNAIAPRVLLYVFDPIMEAQGGAKLHQAYNWENPTTLAAKIVNAFKSNSHGLLQYNIVDTVIADVHPYYKDGTQLSDSEFVTAWANRDFSKSASGFDYIRFINENNLVHRVDNGEIDEVWIYTSPMGGTWESTMAGPSAYWINGPVQNVASTRNFPIMGLNYERGLGEALHSFGHRSESVLDHIYGNQYDDLFTNWDKFRRSNIQAPGQGGVGDIHFPVNGVDHYDYSNEDVVLSNADDWFNYPNFQGITRNISRTEWERADGDWQLGYMNWWYEHLPHVAGRGPDGHLNNWWRYLADINQFKSGDGDLTYTSGIPQITSMTTSINQFTGRVKTDAFVDGALGRVDLYINGTYHSSDTIAPYTFEFNTQSLPSGVHSLQTRAYELQNGTMAVSNTAIFTKENIAPVISIASSNLTYVEDSAAILVASSGTVRDLDSRNFETGRLTVSLPIGATPDDRLSIRSQGNGVGQVSLDSFQVRYQGTVVGTVTGGIGSNPLNVYFNSAATPTVVQAVVRSINFRTVGDNPSIRPRTVRLRLTDGDGGISNIAQRTIAITAVNDAPVVVATGPVSYNLNRTPVIIARTATVRDPDNSSFTNGTLRVWVSAGRTSQDQLTVGGAFSLQGTSVVYAGVVIGSLGQEVGSNGRALSITLNGRATTAVVQNLLRSIRFGTTNSTSMAQRVITFTLRDSLGKSSVPASVAINMI